MVIGTTKNIGIIGYPIKHSLSPTMQNTAIANAKIDYIYVAMSVLPKELGMLVEQGVAAFQSWSNISIKQYYAKSLRKGFSGKKLI